MAWETPVIRATGAAITAAIWNIQVVNDRDNNYNVVQYGGAYASGNVAVGAGANCTFDTTLSGYTGYWAIGNADRFVAVKAGMHVLSAVLVFSGATILTVKKNGSALRTLGSFTNYFSSQAIYLAEGDYLTMACTTARTMGAGSQIILKLMTGGWIDYGRWTSL